VRAQWRLTPPYFTRVALITADRASSKSGAPVVATRAAHP